MTLPPTGVLSSLWGAPGPSGCVGRRGGAARPPSPSKPLFCRLFPEAEDSTGNFPACRRSKAQTESAFMCKTIPRQHALFQDAVPGPRLTPQDCLSHSRKTFTPQDASHAHRTACHACRTASHAAGRLTLAGTPSTLAGPPSRSEDRLSRSGGPSLTPLCVPARPPQPRAPLCSAARQLLGRPWNFLASITTHPELASSHLGMSCCSTAVKSLSSVLICETAWALVCQENTPKLDFLSSFCQRFYRFDRSTNIPEWKEVSAVTSLTIPPPRLASLEGQLPPSTSRPRLPPHSLFAA